MFDIGSSLREARVRQDLDFPELEERTKIRPKYLRALEDEGIVASEWSAELPGPTKRTYTLTSEGHDLLASWLQAVEQLRDGLTDFLERAQKGGDHVRKTPQTRMGPAGSES